MKPKSRQHMDMESAALVLGVLGFGIAVFSWGRASVPASQCCTQLVQRDAELILCEQRLISGLGPTGAV